MTNRELATKIIKRLHKAGRQALLAGGCVRDMLLNRAAKDYDVATDARPDEVVKLFKRTLRIGAKFGVVMVMEADQKVEVATFRTEHGYADGRHPDIVEFADAKADAARRDFTINGMFYDPIAKEVLDFVGGRADLQKGVIRTIGDPASRFGEDYLRMLRAIRFATCLGFKIDEATYRAMCGLAGNITKISGERIAMELEAVFAGPARRRAAQLLVETGLAAVIFPSITGDQARFGVEVLGNLRKDVDFPLAVAAFFAAVDTARARKDVEILRPSSAHAEHLKYLLDSRGLLLNADMSLAELKLVVGRPYFQDLYELQWAIQQASGASLAALKAIKGRADRLEAQQLRPPPLLDGHALIRLGVPPGPMVGLAHREMYIAQLGEELKTPDQAEQWVRKWLEKRQGML